VTTQPLAELSAAIEQEVERRQEVQQLMTHRGVGPITALAFVLDSLHGMSPK